MDNIEYKMNICYFLLLIFCVSMCYSKSIRNINIPPSCKNCIYYKSSLYGDEFSSVDSRCELFNKTNITTGEIEFDLIDSCRDNELKCGKSGKYFKKQYDYIKLLEYFINFF